MQKKCIVIDPQFKRWYGKEFYIIYEREYENSIGQHCVFYTLSDKANVATIATIYLGKSQIKIIENEKVS
jgi:hypothetical protein